MTTNHRPTLESKRGRDISIKDSIQHARSGKGQTSLKYRSDITGAQIDHAKGRNALHELESERKRQKKAEERSQEDAISILRNNLKLKVTNSDGDNGDDGDTPSSDEPEPKAQIVGTRDVIDSNSQKTNESVENSEDDSDSSDASDSDDDDTEALMRELDRVRAEKAQHKKDASLGSNPLIASNGDDTINRKKSWRASSAFSRAKPTTDQSFTTDTLSSDTHKQFLSKYFR